MLAAPPDTADGPATDRCPRCGGGFHCGVADAVPCPCGALQLSADQLSALSQRYQACLCLRCLAAVAADQPV